MVKKILISTILGLIICIPVYAGWFSDFFRTEEENLSAANAGIIDWRYDRFKNLLYGNTNIDTFLIGSTTTSTTGTVFEVQGNSYLDGNATSTFFYASGDITAGGKLYGDGSNLTGITVSGGWATSSSDYWLTIQDTADLTEGTNLYYTDVRVGEYIDASSTMPVGDWNTAYSWGDHSLVGYFDNINDFTGTLTSSKWCIYDGSEIDCNVEPVVNTDTQDLSYDAGTDVISLTDGGSIDITEVDTDTTYTGGDHLTLTGTDFDVDDDFVLNTTDTMTGGLTMNSATTTDTFYISSLGTAAGTFLAVDANGLIIATTTPSGGTVTLAGQDYLTITAQEITAGEIEPDDLAASDFGEFTCNGTTCVLEATNTTLTTLANVVEVGALNAGSITSGFTSIDVGAGAIDGGVITADTNFAGDITGAVTGAASGNLLNSESDTLIGTLTADGLTLGSTEILTIGTNLFTHDGTDFTLDDTLVVTGYASSTLGLNTQGTLHIGGNSTFDGTGHDSFSDYVADEHLNWKNSVGTIHADNYTNTTYTGGTNLTLDGTAFDVDDAFLVNDAADIGVGITLTYSTTTGTMTIPQGAAPEVTVIGQIALDSSDDQLIVMGATEKVIRTDEAIFRFTFASTSPDFVSGGELPVPPEKDGYTITSYSCYVTGGTSVVLTPNGASQGDLDAITCATTITKDTTMTAASIIAADELVKMKIGTVTGVPDYVSFTAFGKWTRE